MGCPCGKATNPRQQRTTSEQAATPPAGSGRGYHWTGPRAAKTTAKTPKK